MSLRRLNTLYKAVILDHYQKPRHCHKLTDPTSKVDIYNPSCGDVLHIELKTEDEKIKEIGFTGEGCAISMASASMMCEKVEGFNFSEAMDLHDVFQEMLIAEEEPEQSDLEEKLGEASLLVGVRQFPARVKCATLAWQALAQALTKEGES